MTDRPPLRVWVLGAGFSRSLGGPLLPQLLTRAARANSLVRFPKGDFPDIHGTASTWVMRLYHYGRRYFEGEPFKGDNKRAEGGQDLWRDAEDFVDYLDAAPSPSSPALGRLVDIANELRQQKTPLVLDFDRLGTVAKKMIAAECCAFIHDGALATERWEPYRDWIRKLGRDDYIITFNYDLVLEKIRNVVVVTSDTDGYEASKTETPKVLKLHGSVDWKREQGGARFSRTTDEFFALRCTPEELAIATPGPSKKATTQELAFLWDMAANVLRQAGTIIFVGYRFPPSDAQARSVLLKAIGENEVAHTAVPTVLGPDTTSVDSMRLKALLERAVERKPKGSRAVGSVPLFAEDFLGLFENP